MAILSNPRQLLSVTGFNVFAGDVIRDLTLSSNAFVVAADIANHGITIEIKLERTTKSYAEKIARRAQARAPVGETGRLRDSIEARKIDEAEYMVRPWMVPYAHIVEFGYGRQPPKPFITPAADMFEPRFERAIAKLIDEDLD